MEVKLLQYTYVQLYAVTDILRAFDFCWFLFSHVVALNKYVWLMVFAVITSKFIYRHFFAVKITCGVLHGILHLR